MYKNPEVKTFNELKHKQEKILGVFSNEFDKVIKEYGINKEQNREWSEEYYSLKNDTGKLQKKIKKLKVFKWITLIPLIFPFFLINSKIKKLQPQVGANNERLAELENKLSNQLKNVKHIFSLNWMNENVLKSWDDFKLDLFFANQNAVDLEQEYNNFMNEDSCCQDLIGGTLFEHPFALFNKKEQLWKQEIYTNSVTLPYTTRINGQPTTMFETVIGTYYHPAPFWNIDTKLIYRANFNPNLTFTTNCSKKEFKKLEKTSQIKLENQEFNKNVRVIRNDETGIRVVLTPLAQEMLNSLFKEKKYWLTKVGNSTIVDLPENHATLYYPDFDCFDYSLDIWKQKLGNELNSFVKTLGVFSLPIANMPVYYQMNNKINNNKCFLRLQAQSDMNYLYNGRVINFDTNVIFNPIEMYQTKAKNIDFNIYKIQCNWFQPEAKTTTVMEPSLHHGLVPITINYIDYQPITTTMYLAQSINYNGQISTKNCYLRGNQIIAISNKRFSDNLNEIIK